MRCPPGNVKGTRGRERLRGLKLAHWTGCGNDSREGWGEGDPAGGKCQERFRFVVVSVVRRTDPVDPFPACRARPARTPGPAAPRSSAPSITNGAAVPAKPATSPADAGAGWRLRPVSGQPQGERGGAGALRGRLDDRGHRQGLSHAQAETEYGEHHGQRPHRDGQGDARAEQFGRQAGGGEQGGAAE
ncbi:hypothetical protein Sfulv_10400 [Streptomyces fulvorobeus]|uniref:Uncharacterized protein n=1 Tax=Streptomyces fulvorobeus TaxID=284028 RepID=A0A7J0C141_9ACTN|nr:hypothetical protein Sfulv_10400 [Streptomyces fulvorobeus]